MLFTEPTFLFVFFPICLVFQYLLRSIAARNIILLIMSLMFYAWGEPVYVILMILTSLLSWTLTKIMHDNGNKKILLALAVVVSLLPLLFFKYGQMILDIVNLIPYVSITMPKVSLPIGISFYSFQILTYVIDVYKGEAKVQKNPLYFMLYISLFPQLIAGPIVRYTEVEKELQVRSMTPEMFSLGVYRFVIGLSKKVLLANVVGKVVSDVFSRPVSEIGTFGLWGAMLCYTFQIYFDFSGYSDMAIGLGKMLGFTYNENFNYPYIANSVKDFWRRWHISMSSFFRDYIYIPLGGNRKRRVFNMFVVWATTGLWHGAGYNFILWGLYFFVLLYIEGLILNRFKIPKLISTPITFLLVLIGWVFFYIEDLSDCATVLKSMFGFGKLLSDPISNSLVISAIPAIIICAFLSTPIFQKTVDKLSAKLPEWLRIAVLALFIIIMFILCTAFTISSTYNPFIYFNF